MTFIWSQKFLFVLEDTLQEYFYYYFKEYHEISDILSDSMHVDSLVSYVNILSEIHILNQKLVDLFLKGGLNPDN